MCIYIFFKNFIQNSLVCSLLIAKIKRLSGYSKNSLVIGLAGAFNIDKPIKQQMEAVKDIMNCAKRYVSGQCYQVIFKAFCIKLKQISLASFFFVLEHITLHLTDPGEL